MLSRAAKRHTRIRFGKIKQKHLLKDKERGIFMAELTPMMKQYLEIKKDNPDLPAFETYDELLAAIKKAL